MASHIVAAVLSRFQGSSYAVSTTYALIASVLAVWDTWYIWTFIFSPELNPREPKQVPYLLPIAGHTVKFFNDSERLYMRCRKYFQNTREPFAITIMGQRLYILTSPDDASRVYKKTTSLGFDAFAKQMFTSFGVTEDGMRKMWQQPRESSSMPGDERKKALIHAVSDYDRLQLLPGKHLEDL